VGQQRLLGPNEVDLVEREQDGLLQACDFGEDRGVAVEPRRGVGRVCDHDDRVRVGQRSGGLAVHPLAEAAVRTVNAWGVQGRSAARLPW
jgi:hypothetical protein